MDKKTKIMFLEENFKLAEEAGFEVKVNCLTYIEKAMQEYTSMVMKESGKKQYSHGHSIGYQKGKREANIRNKRGY